ncbi:hypothetical protein [Polymorphum gilvum]|uniref:Holin of 3TMs, for gene-transfer release n=1 Tax=Polymorphum gilvum (strain LMG 25793 / CGMCC 1.9160 / SL003B-26A1) TaxID=991905 RepID=F2J6G4_POLGS|nr:hypothetical protein [Polymorphum gilvum]ADZ71338.1 hypothetical protein SL003B_2915 [Polymorphum gilvum SL003B-26A1]
MIGTLLQWLSGGVLDRLLAHLERRVEGETARRRIEADLAAEEIRAEIEARKVARAVLIAESGHLLSAGRLGRLVFVLPLGLWWAAVCLDSVFHFGWRIAEVPVLRDWGGAIVTSLFLVDGARGMARGLAARRGGVVS